MLTSNEELYYTNRTTDVKMYLKNDENNIASYAS